MSIYLIGISTYISEKKRLGRRRIMGNYVKPWQENGSKSNLTLLPPAEELAELYVERQTRPHRD